MQFKNKNADTYFKWNDDHLRNFHFTLTSKKKKERIKYDEHGSIESRYEKIFLEKDKNKNLQLYVHIEFITDFIQMFRWKP